MSEARVAMLTPHGDPLGRIGEPEVGGQCVYVRELATRLAQLGLLVTAYTRDRGEGRPARELIGRGAGVVRVPVGPRRFVPKEEIGPFLGEFAAFVQGRLGEGEVVHSHFWDGAAVADRISAGRTWVHASHSLGLRKFADSADEERRKHRERFEAEGLACSRSTSLVASTALEQQDLVQLYGASREKVHIIPPGVDTARFTPPPSKRACRAKLGLPEEGAIVAALGRLDPRKGFDLFLRAAGELTLAGVKATFVLSTGVPGDEREQEEQARLTAIREECALGDAVVWLGILPEADLPDFYGAADVLVLPSRYELFGIVMIEAMACGVPVVATRFGGPAEVISDGVDGMLVDPRDIRSTAHGIRTLLEAPSLREAMGAAARERVERTYDWGVSAQRHLELYGLVPGRE